MYSVSEAFAEKIISDDRAFAVRLTFGSSTVITGTTIQSITLDEITNSTDALTMGCACSNKITINLINPPTDIDYDGTTFTAEVGLLLNDRPTTYEYIPLGKFYATEPQTSNDFKNLKLIAYDGFCKMTGTYNATVPSQTTLQAVYNDLREQLLSKCGIILKERTLPDYSINNFPYLEISYAQAIGYVAGCLGGFARFDRYGELEIAWYSDFDQDILRNSQYLNGFSRTTKNQLTVTSIATGTKDNPIVRGLGANGTQITFENPYITETMADDIFATVNGLTYTPCKVKWRGNPAIQAGDIVQVFDKDDIPHNVLIMSQSLIIGGGCNATIECKGTSETKSEFSTRFESVGQKIERVYATLEQAILNATNAITGNKGGYVIIHDNNNDSHPDEILVLDTQDILSATQVWRWNKAGLGYASNPAGGAYNGPYELAITADGQINASFITTGRLNADLIVVGDEKFGDYINIKDGVMKFGNANDPFSLRLGNISADGVSTQQVAFYYNDKRIGFFSPNSFEIENLEDGRIRFQNFEWITRSNGNLSFTKSNITT